MRDLPRTALPPGADPVRAKLLDLRKGSCDATRWAAGVRSGWPFFPSALALVHENGLVEALFASVWPSELPVLETYGNVSETNEYAKPCKKRPESILGRITCSLLWVP